jgi:hypothetical protein
MLKPILLAATAVLALSACQSSPTKPTKAAGDTAETLEQRAGKRWDLLLARKGAEAYDFLTPGYRQTISRENYANVTASPQIAWTKATVGEKKCESEDVCELQMLIEVQTQIPNAGIQTFPTSYSEKWLKIDGAWYFLPKK